MDYQYNDSQSFLIVLLCAIRPRVYAAGRTIKKLLCGIPQSSFFVR